MKVMDWELKREEIMKKLTNYLPFIIDLILSLIATIVYSVITEEKEFIAYVQFLVGPVLLLAIQLLNLTKLVRIPILLNYLLMLHLIMALLLGSGFKFYDLIPSWDMILHGYFGFLCSALVFCILLNFNGEKLSLILILVLIFFVTMGAAGMWEICEFTMDSLTGSDTQRIQESIDNGHTPVYDTMMDLIIAIPGILLFYLYILIDKLNKYRITAYLYKDIKRINQ